MHSFSDIYGNALLLRHLQQAVAGGRVSHAYLLTGSSGSGKRLIADTFAKTLQCEAGGTEPCGHCKPGYCVRPPHQKDIGRGRCAGADIGGRESETVSLLL